jgi:hypothetical protein
LHWTDPELGLAANPVRLPPHIHFTGPIPDGITIEFRIEVGFTVEVEVSCISCGKEKKSHAPFKFKREIEIPFTLKGFHFITKVLSISIPGAQLIAIGTTLLEIYETLENAKHILENIQSAWDTHQALSRCTKKRALLIGISPVEELELSPELAAKILEMLKLPEDWQSHSSLNAPNPSGICPIYANVSELKGKYCLCHNSEGVKEMDDCSVYDKLPASHRGNVDWKNAQCLPVNCNPVKNNQTIMTVIIPAALDVISDESARSFLSQIEEKVGSGNVTLVGVAQGNGTSGTTELRVQVPEPQLHSLESVHSLSAPDGRVFPVTIGGHEKSTMHKWTYIILGGVVFLTLLILILVVVAFFKGLIHERKERKREGDDVRYVAT